MTAEIRTPQPITDLTPAELRAGAAAHGYRNTTPTEAEREAALVRELAKLPHGLAETAAHLRERGLAAGVASYECSYCGWGAEIGGDPEDDLARLRSVLEDAAYGHTSRADLLAVSHRVALPGAQLGDWLGRAR